MKFLITRTTGSWDSKEVKEINSLEELIAFQKQWNEPIILLVNRKDNNDEPDYKLEIYDDYRE